MFMKIKRNHLVIGVALLATSLMGLVACAPAATLVPPTLVPTNPAPPTTVPTVAPAQAAAFTIQLGQKDQLGKFLADGNDRTLYLFTKDSKDTSNCNDSCAQAWPPIPSTSKPDLKEGLNAALIGSTQRKDGTTQLTYNGWPLYYFGKDQQAGDTNGQAVGSVWWVVSAEGNPVKPTGLQMSNNDKLGKFLGDDAGRSVYAFTKDTKDTTVCYDKCEQSWPPVLTLGQPTLKDGINSALVGSIQRKDGTMQVTYNGMPLYYFANDKAPADTTGQAVGNVWWVVSAEGNLVKPTGLQVDTNDKLGKFLGDDTGRTVYAFTKDTKDTSVCYDKCEQSWPPVLTLGQPTLKDGINSALVGSIQRKDGTMQVTYNGMPLYYFANDKAPADTTGQAVGNVWWVVSAEGNLVKPTGLQVDTNDKLGKILGDDAGRTVYAFTKDTKDTTVCYDKCEQSWPPLLTLGQPTLKDRINSALVGSIQRKDGTMQVTYNGMPLYYFANDKAPADTTGQAVGGVWYVVTPDGGLGK